MRVLVTGGAGFIGHHLSNILFELGHDVTVWDNLSTGKRERLHYGIGFIYIDINEDILPNQEYDAVFHLASPTSVQESLENHLKYKWGCYEMTKKIFEWSVKNEVKYFTFASTAAVYGPTDRLPASETHEPNPISPYAEYKLKAEEYLIEESKNHDIQISITRFFNVFGEEQPHSGSYAPAVGIFLKQYKENIPITVTGDGNQTRDYIYVKDVVYALLSTIEKQSYSVDIFNIGSGEEITILDIAKSFNHPIVHIEERNEPNRSLSDISKIKNQFKWKPHYNILGWIKLKLGNG